MSRVGSIIDSLDDIHEKKIDIDSISDKYKNGNCYEAAMKQMWDYYRKGIKEVKLVHGVVTGQGELDGIQFSHAWIEVNGIVLDMSNGREVVMPKNLYYKLGKIKITREYDYEDMLKMIDKYGTYGPWDKVFNKYP